MKILVLTLLILLTVEIGPPLWRATVCDGLDATGDVCLIRTVLAHDKPPKDPPAPTPDSPRRDLDGPRATEDGWVWYVVRRADPAQRPVYGPWLAPVPECQAWVYRFPTIYACVRVKTP